jgi:hypothetical protein
VSERTARCGPFCLSVTLCLALFRANLWLGHALISRLLGFAGWTFGDMLRDKKEIEALKKV